MSTSLLARDNIENYDYRWPLNQVEVSTGALPHSKEINRLLTAAIVSRRFCSLLLTDPIQALTKGYNGETFKLTAEEVQQIRAIKASSLRDFALQLIKGHVHEKTATEAQLTSWRNKIYVKA